MFVDTAWNLAPKIIKFNWPSLRYIYAWKHYMSQHWVCFVNYCWLNYKPVVYSEQKNSTILWTRTQVICRYSSEGGLTILSEVLDHQHGVLKYSVILTQPERAHHQFGTGHVSLPIRQAAFGKYYRRAPTAILIRSLAYKWLHFSILQHY